LWLLEFFYLGHIRLAVDHIDSLIEVFNQLLESLLSDEYLISLEKTEDVKRVSVMPDHLRMILLGELEVLVAFLPSDHA
jgi:hypothetical protein